MAGGEIEENAEKLAQRCERFMEGAKSLYDSKKGPMSGDMWLFELYHHLNDCSAALKIAEK